MSLSARTIAASIRTLEQALNLEDPDWVISDVHLWPLYRMELYRLFFAAQGGGSAGAATPRIGFAFRHVQTNGAAAAPPHRVWLVSDGISFAKLGPRDFERFCAPLQRGCEALGVPAVVIDRGSEAPRSSAEPTRWWAPLTQRAKVAGMLAARMAPTARHPRLVAALHVAAERQGLHLPPLQAVRLDAMSRAVLSLAGTLEGRMRKERVRAVFVVGYYDVGGYAYTLAAARVGALSIDVQHGVTGEQHMGYANWRVAPRAGLKLLPQCFWTWTEGDAQVIEQWAGQQAPARRAVVAGHPFISLWKSGGLPLPSSMATQLGDLVRSADDRPKVLVTLQPNVMSREMLGPLLQAWEAQPQVAWWLRLHPLAMRDRDGVEALLREHGVAHWNIDVATAAPLPALLTEATLHATHSSSVVIEADLIGIPSIVWSVYGAELIPALVKKGSVHVALDGRSFLDKLHSMESPTRFPTIDSDHLTQRALRTLLDIAP